MTDKYHTSQTNLSETFYTTPNIPPNMNPIGISQTSLTASEVSRMVNSEVKDGQVVKGNSRINYVPYERKVIEYENRQVVEKVPVKRKVVEYREEKYVEEVPREVVRTEYYAVENIKQYYKEVIPERRIQMVPVERKIKKVQYVPTEKQIVHYPQGTTSEADVKGKSRVILQSQGINVRSDAEYKPINPKLLYDYSGNENTKTKPVGYVEDGNRRYLSTSPSPFQEQQLHAPTPSSFNQMSFNPQHYETQPYTTSTPSQKGSLQQSVMYSSEVPPPNQPSPYYFQQPFQQPFPTSQQQSYPLEGNGIDETPINRSKLHELCQRQY